MPLDAARWQIDLMAADKTANAFNSVQNRMKATQVQATATASTMSSGFSSVAGMAARLSPILLGIAAAQKVWSAGMRAGDLGEQAEQIGLTTDQLQAYRFAAAQAGVGNEQLDTAMTKLTRSIGAAGEGSDDMIAKFDKLGVKLLDGEGKLRKVSAVAPEVARGLLAIESETERNALMMDLFGKSGMKMVTVLGDLAKGNESLVDAAKKQNAIIGPEVIKAWDDLGDRLIANNQRLDTLLATMGRPIAGGALLFLNSQLAMTAGLLEKIGKFGQFVGKTASDALEGGSSEDLIKRQETIKASMDVLKDSTDALDVAKLAGYRQELTRISDVLAGRAKVYEMPAAVITGDAPGKGQPVGKGAAKAGADAAAALAKKQREESEKVYKDILDNIEKVRKAGEAMTDRFGSGMETATRKTEELNEMLLQGAIAPETYANAMRSINMEAEAQARTFAAAKGGVEGFMAGIEQGLVDLAVVNREFEYGRAVVDMFSESIDILAGVSNKSFGQMALDFALMVAKMEAAAAASQAWKALGGLSGLGGLFGDLFSSGGTAAAQAAVGGGIPMLAGGGPFDGAAIVGENGPELVVGRGHVYNRDQVRGMGGGGTIVINMGGYTVGDLVTPAQLDRAMRVTYDAALKGTQQALIQQGRHGVRSIKGALR